MPMVTKDIHEVVMLILNKSHYVHEKGKIEDLTKEVYKKYKKAKTALLEEIENDKPKE